MTFDSREKSGYSGQPVECYRFSVGATTYLWTSASEAQTITPGTFTPQAISRTALEFSNEDAAGSTVVSLPLDNALVGPLLAAPYGTQVALTIFRFHRGEEADYRAIFSGISYGAAMKDDHAELTFAPFGRALDRNVPAITCSPICNWALYSVGCGVNQAAFTDSGTVQAVTSATQLSIASLPTHPDHWYKGGWIKNAAGDLRMIVDSSVSGANVVLTLLTPFSPQLSVSDAVTVVAGCDRLYSTCVTKFNNVANFMGFPWMPGLNPFLGRVT